MPEKIKKQPREGDLVILKYNGDLGIITSVFNIEWGTYRYTIMQDNGWSSDYFKSDFIVIDHFDDNFEDILHDLKNIEKRFKEWQWTFSKECHKLLHIVYDMFDNTAKQEAEIIHCANLLCTYNPLSEDPAEVIKEVEQKLRQLGKDKA